MCLYLKGNPFRIQLGQYRDHLLHLKIRWANPLASSIRFDSHVAEASSVASRLTGHSEISSQWSYVSNATEVDADADNQDGEEMDANLPHHELLARDEEVGAIVASEIFEGEDSDDEDSVLRNPPALAMAQDVSDDDDVVFLGVSQAKKAEGRDVVTMGYCENAMSFSWTAPVRYNSIATRIP